jgi:hypothetical protein
LTSRGERFAGVALLVVVLGLAVHNAAMAQLWELGVRGGALDVLAAWKEALLLAAVVAVAWSARRSLPPVRTIDVLAGAYAAIVLVYALVPQGWLDGEATTRGELLALRHHLLPVGAYFLGRLVSRLFDERNRLHGVVVVSAVVVAVVGLADLAFLTLQSWRDSGVPGWYRELGLDYEGLSGLPENWVYNTGDEDNPLRRLVSTLLSPLASAYVLVVALVYIVGRPFRVWWALLGLLLYAGLLYTHTRAAFGALAVGLVVLALAQRRLAPAVLAAASLAVGAAFLVAFPAIGPSTSYTQEELEWLRQNAQDEGDTSDDPFSGSESSTASHWRNLREGIRAVLEHPQGYGPGNAGVVAKRTGVEIRAGESTYTELGVDAGLAGLVAFVLWSVALLVALLRREAWLGAAFAAVLLLGLQTDIIGVHWLAVAVWAAAGVAVSPAPEDEEVEEAEEPELQEGDGEDPRSDEGTRVPSSESS